MGIITVKKKITKILCWCLSVATLLTSVPITSYADINANAGGGGASGSWTGGSGAVTMSASQIGIRFTIVDGKTGETKSLVNGKPGSLDVLYTNEPKGIVKKMKTSWFQDINTEAEIRIESISTVMDWIKTDAGDSVPNLVPWVMSSNGAVHTYGAEIKKWMMTGNSIPYTIGSNNSSNSSHSGNSSNSSSGSSGGTSSGSSGGSSRGSTTTSKQVSSSSVKSTLIGTINNGFKSQASNWTQLYTKAVTNTDKKALAQRINNYNASLKSTMYYYREDLSSADYAYLLRLIDSKTASAKSKYGVTGLASAITDGLKGLFGPITAYASETKTGVNPVIPMDEGQVKPKNSGGYASYLINLHDKNGFILDLEGSRLVKTSDEKIDANASITPLDIMAQNGYKLIAEPIIFGRPAHYTTKYTCKYSIYGTGANWIRYSETGFNGDPSYSESGGSYMRLTNMAMPNGMTIENPDTELGVKKPTSLKSKMSWAEQRAALGDKQGLSLHIYSINSDNAAIPTWDSVTYPVDNYKPGPAPSGDTYPDETSYGQNSKTFKIMKYYEVS